MSPLGRRSAACCRGWGRYCTRLGSQRNRLPSDSVSPKPEEKEGSLGVWRREGPKTRACAAGPLTRWLETPHNCGSRRPNYSQGSVSCCQAGAACHRGLGPSGLCPELCIWCELTGSLSLPFRVQTNDILTHGGDKAQPGDVAGWDLGLVISQDSPRRHGPWARGGWAMGCLPFV